MVSADDEIDSLSSLSSAVLNSSSRNTTITAILSAREFFFVHIANDSLTRLKKEKERNIN